MQFDELRRREFITLLGGVAAWPVAARAQQGERMRRVGVLNTLAADDVLAQARQGAFLQGLQQSGWTIGRNVQVEARWAAGDPDRLRKYAAELAALAPDVILATGNAAAAPLLQATRTVPIVFVIVPDPSPEIRSGRGIDELAGDAHSSPRLAHTAFEHVAHPELAAHLLHVLQSDLCR
jgi:putative ABC transport system substrate-binding protein